MTLISSDGKMYVDVGGSDIWNALYSTMVVRLNADKRELKLAKKFLETGACTSKDALETARSINCLRDALAAVPPEKMVYDAKDPSKKAPWANDISPVITSCGNYFITADGKDLLYELVSILTHAYYAKAEVSFA